MACYTFGGIARILYGTEMCSANDDFCVAFVAHFGAFSHLVTDNCSGQNPELPTAFVPFKCPEATTRVSSDLGENFPTENIRLQRFAPMSEIF